MADLNDRAKRIALLVLDVDGVLTDGTIYYGNAGEELKGFSIKDGLGIKLLQRDGIAVAIITGRESAIVSRRAAELGIEDVIQGREDKLVALRDLCLDKQLDLDQCAYMGDDLPDLAAVTAAGLGLTVQDAAGPVRDAADWVSSLPGGSGAVREACEMILSARGSMAAMLDAYRQ